MQSLSSFTLCGALALTAVTLQGCGEDAVQERVNRIIDFACEGATGQALVRIVSAATTDLEGRCDPLTEKIGTGAYDTCVEQGSEGIEPIKRQADESLLEDCKSSLRSKLGSASELLIKTATDQATNFFKDHNITSERFANILEEKVKEAVDAAKNGNLGNYTQGQVRSATEKMVNLLCDEVVENGMQAIREAGTAKLEKLCKMATGDAYDTCVQKGIEVIENIGSSSASLDAKCKKELMDKVDSGKLMQFGKDTVTKYLKDHDGDISKIRDDLLQRLVAVEENQAFAEEAPQAGQRSVLLGIGLAALTCGAVVAGLHRVRASSPKAEDHDFRLLIDA